MCVVSAIGDYTAKEWKHWIYRPEPWNPVIVPPNPVSREEFEELKDKLEELKTLLLAAKAYDEKTSQPHCEVEDKVAVIKKLMEYFGVDSKDIFDE